MNKVILIIVFSVLLSFQGLLSGDTMDIRVPPDEIRIEADNIEFQEERQQIYCRGNVEILTERGMVYAGQALVDLSAREIYASDNVRFERADAGEYQVEHLRYNYEFDYLYIEELKGQEMFITYAMSEVHSHAREEISGQDGWITHCDLPHPHYRVRTGEMEIYLNQRVYARGAKFCIYHTPVFYLPVYSRNLGEKSPWSFSAGYESDKGGSLKVGYLFRNQYYADRRQRERLSTWSLLVQGEHYTRRGTGLLTYAKIGTLDDAWLGRLFGYYIEDDKYDISRRLHRDEVDEKYDYDVDRYTLTSENRFELPRDWLWHLNFEYHSDPDVYQDFVEAHSPEELRVQRGAESVISRVFRDHYFSVSMRYKERLNRNIYRDNYRYWWDDTDFDGIDYYRTQLQLPVASLERRYLPLTEFLMYKYRLEFFNVLDPGLMPQSSADEKRITGFMLDNKLFFNYFFTPRFSFESTSGLKGGYVRYSEDRFGDQRFYDLEGTDAWWLTPGMVDRAYNQIDSTQISAYSLNTLNFHVADNLRLYTFYNHVHNFGYTSGDFFQEIADKRFKEDVYPFPVATRMVGGGFEHTWDSPNYRLNFEMAENIRSNLFPRETIRYARADVSVRNEADTFSLFAGPAWHKINDLLVLFPDGLDQPGEYYEYERDIYSLYAGFDYRHLERWRLGVIFNASREKEDHPEKPEDRRVLDQVYSHVTANFELKISDRYFMNSHVSYDINQSDVGYASLGLSRLLHCWRVGMNVQMRKNLDEFSRDYGDSKFRYSVYLGLEGIPGGGFQSRDVSEGLATSHEIPRRMETLSR